MKKYFSRLIAGLLVLSLLAAPASALTVDQALELLDENYYYEIPEEARQAQSLDELFLLLGDPYTQYLSPEQYDAFLNLVEDTVDMVGVGVVIQYTDQGFLLDDLVPGGSAQEAGLRPGDLIVAIDGTSCVPAALEHRQLLLGRENSQVTVTVLRDGQAQDYTLTRRAVYIPNTQIALLDGNVGYVDCNSFGSDTGELFLQGLEEYDGQVECWLVDLRGNVGGYVASAVEMAAAVGGPGSYLYFEDQNGYVTGYVSEDAAVTSKPLILLVDGDSASASELFASGVRDVSRGVLVGSRTYGKGVAQNILDEESDPDYFDGDGLKVTTARFYGAGTTTTDKIGVIPTLLVDDAYTAAVASALAGGSKTSSSLSVAPGGPSAFYVDPDAPEDVLARLLEAVPPQMPLFYNAGSVFNQITPAQAAEAMGLDGFSSRWFGDVADSPYADAINALGTYRLVGGTAPGVFTPKGQLTRAQLCVMLARVLNVSASGPSRFSDVADGAWYAGGVNAMAELGLVNGVGGGKFDPDSPVTQQQFLAILGRAARYVSFALENYGQRVEANANRLPADMRGDLAPYARWSYGDVAVLAWGLTDALGGRGSMLYTELKDITPSAPVLREEAAAGIYALLSGLEILP